MLRRPSITHDWSRSTLSKYKSYAFQAKHQDKDIVCILKYSCSSKSEHYANPESFIQKTISGILSTATDLSHVDLTIIGELNKKAILVERGSLNYASISPSKVFGS